MDINQQLWIIAQEGHSEVERWLMWAGLALLGTMIAGWLIWFNVNWLTKMMRWIKAHRLDAVLMAPFVLGLVYVGSTKGTGGSVSFPYTDIEKRYIWDAGSYVTNDAVHVAWQRSAIVPDTADFYGAARPVGNTNDEDWVVFLATDFTKITSPTNIPYIGAQTNNFVFYTTYTPGPTVHTNGVAVILWQTNYANETNKFVTYRTGIYNGTLRLSPNHSITNGPAGVASLIMEIKKEEEE